MQNKALCDHSLTELVALIRKREVSPREVVEAHLQRISLMNPQLNAIVTLNSQAFEQAGLVAGDLGGLPITIKDTIEETPPGTWLCTFSDVLPVVCAISASSSASACSMPRGQGQK